MKMKTESTKKNLFTRKNNDSTTTTAATAAASAASFANYKSWKHSNSI